MDIYTARCFESGILINEGNGNFRFKPFDEKAQLSTINDLIFADLDKDGIRDILACGNSDDAAVMVGNYDATAAILLKGDGKGGFIPVAPFTAGFNIRVK